MTSEAPTLRRHGNAYNIFILVLTIFSWARWSCCSCRCQPAERDLLPCTTTSSA